MKYLLYYLLFIVIILCFAYINTLPQQESFTPNVRAYYRPIVRRTRLATESFKTKVTNTFEGFKKQLGF
jgi:hypothetical protein